MLTAASSLAPGTQAGGVTISARPSLTLGYSQGAWHLVTLTCSFGGSTPSFLYRLWRDGTAVSSALTLICQEGQGNYDI